MGEDDILSISLTLDEARKRYPLQRMDPTDPRGADHFLRFHHG